MADHEITFYITGISVSLRKAVSFPWQIESTENCWS